MLVVVGLFVTVGLCAQNSKKGHTKIV